MNRILYPSRRIPSDVFHGDPFKIQSYNFRYADKPFYPIQNYQRPPPPAPPPLVTKPSFQTFYHNPRFSQDPEYIPAKRSLPTCSVSEHRKRRLQQDSKAPQTRRPPNPSTVTDSPLLRSCCQSGAYQTMRRDQSSTTLRSNRSNHLRATGGGIRKASATTFCRGSNTRLESKRSACSGCEINISICSMDPQSEVENNNVSIKIEADAYLLNNTDRVKPNTEQSSSSRCTGAFGIDIDKRLSKFNVSETKPRTSPEWELRQKEKVREEERRRQLREDLRLEQERERQEERERARQRERDREHLRQLERQRDRQRLLELEEERERHRLRELERESQRCREFHRLCVLQQQLHRAEAKPMKPRPSVPMTSHLCAVTSDDRLPGMAYCDLPSRRSERSEVSRRRQPVPKERPTTPFGQRKETVAFATRSLTPPRSSTPPPMASSRSSSPTGSTNCSSSSRSSSPIRNTTIPRNLDRSTSGTSNGNVHVTVTSNGVQSSCSMRRSSNARVSEPKQLNGGQPLVTSLNSMPIRITTSRTTDRDLAFSMNHVRMRGSSPATREGSRSVESRDACQVKIDVFADNLRRMRL
ncbi:putative uncharacterized protein DDB_G0271982 [Drosophila elegans]|uniref:putative uncharacterized protein DDB_G0271982 n=1 Tax=Drosophila elegans TaxID=30023 RepID=UPI0007E8B4E7|nr:putative uncharacterized protein DDB_G0271982 [Drosophila elegans]